MTNNESWLNMLSKMNFPVTAEIQTGECINHVYDETKNILRIYLSFDSLIPVQLLNNLLTRTKEYFAKTSSSIDVRFTVSYKNPFFKESLIEEYFKCAIEQFGKLRKDILILNKYKIVDYKSGEIIVHVPDLTEKEVCDKAIDQIKKYFDNYGMGSIEIFSIIDDGVVSTKKSHDLAFDAVETKNTAIANEEYRKRVEFNKTAIDETYQPKYKNQLLDIKITDVPYTSMELNEFEQIHNTNKVRITGVLTAGSLNNIKSKKDGKEYSYFLGTLSVGDSSILIKRFYKEFEADFFKTQVMTCEKKAINATITGKMQWDSYVNDVIIMADTITIHSVDTSRHRFDGCEKKRVELHAHTKMSILDSILNVDEYVEQAKRYGHTALAVTDHENCHVLPEFFNICKKNNIKPIAGLEANFIDEDLLKATLTDGDDIDLNNATFVIFDLETTGFSVHYDEITEIGAVKVCCGMIIDEFQSFVKPRKRISDYIAELTDISNDTVYDAPNIDYILPEFKKFIDGCVLVGHNVNFDTGFIYENMRKLGIYEKDYPAIDTLALAKILYAETGLKRFNLGSCGKFLKVEIEQQHRAIHDAKTTNNVFMRMISDLNNLKITNYNELNDLANKFPLYRYQIPTHLNILVKNRTGLKNFYKIVSDSQTTHYFKSAKVLSSVLEKYREGILVGSGCYNGEIFRAAWEQSDKTLEKLMTRYDFIEVQPPTCYMHLYDKTKDPSGLEYIKDTIKRIIQTAEKLNIPVCATGDVHELTKEDCEYRKIYLSINRPNGGGPHELNGMDDMLDMHFRSTTEMLEEFKFIGDAKAMEIVVNNTNKIADLCEQYDLFPKELFIPADDFQSSYGVPSMKQAIIDMCNSNVKSLYGENPPKYVMDRMNKELDAIIGHGYFSVYYISHMLVKNSVDHGYFVGSRGSVGSSFVATLMNITEVNPLVPHYLCPKCHYSAFKYHKEDVEKYPQYDVTDEIIKALNDALVGFDLPEIACPHCGAIMDRIGSDIKFETFLGFTGEKCPDIDLNFSGEYQDKAHLFVQKAFGREYAFRAGTVGTVANKTAFAYVRDYYSNKNINKRQCEMERLAKFLEGSKRNTGQHPGGIVVVPNNIEIYDVTPIQYPPVTDDEVLEGINWRTTHFEYHSFENNLLKLDILGHDDPTLLKHLNDYVLKYPEKFPFKSIEQVPVIDENILSLFSSKKILNISGEDLDPFDSGTIGIPEFGTNFVRGMLQTIKPNNYADIIKVSGLAHGTNVWQGNAESLVLHEHEEFPTVSFKEIIGCRDDIMVFLMKYHVDDATSFKIMEAVRKGKGLDPEQEKIMREHDVPDWFIWSCKRIAYLFPKAHATAYVTSALRIAWFKIYRPIYYYSVYFSIRADELDCEIFANGKNAIKNKINDIKSRQDRREEVSKKELALYDELFIALEMVLRGYNFNMIDLEKSDASQFIISEDERSLYMPFSALDGLGLAAAEKLCLARSEHPFTSKADVKNRSGLNKTQFANLLRLHVFDNLPDDDPNVLF